MIGEKTKGNRFRSLTRNWLFWVIVITSIAIVIRSVPAWTNSAWGCDFGIYYGLTNSFVENKALFNVYNGWGSSYQYFPVLYVVTGIAHWITGLDVLTVMPKLAPIFGGLSVLIFYFVVYELLGDRKKALLASMFLAVLPFHVYQTSHAAPLTIGHFFMMLSLYFFIKFRKDNRYAIPLVCSTVLLTMSHHLTTYFYLICLVAIVFVENTLKKEWTKTVKKDSAYILLTSGIVFSYWIFIAKPVYEQFMRMTPRIGPLSIPPTFIIALFYLVFFTMFGVILLQRRLNLFRNPKDPSARICAMKFFVSVIVCLVALSIFSVVKMPWTNFRFTPLSLLYALPLVVVIGFSVAGFRFTRHIQNGGFIRGWIFALLLSFFYALITQNSTLPPDRHLEYIMVPLSIIVVYGIDGIFFNQRSETFARLKKTVRNLHSPSHPPLRTMRFIKKQQLLYMIVVIVLVATNAVSVYPGYTSLNAADEVISNKDVAVIYWMEKNVDKNMSVIASDHRLARMTEAVGFNTTLDEASILWVAENLSDYLDELNGVGKNYTRITHVLIDNIMKEQVVHVYFGEIYYMTNVSYDKFSSPPFMLLYRNETVNQEGVVERWSEVYAVNWTLLQK